MMAGNPRWWSMHSDLRSAAAESDHDEAVSPNLFLSQTHPSSTSLLPLHDYLHPSSSSTTSSASSCSLTSSLPQEHHHAHDHQFPHSWSQLLLGGLPIHDDQEDERFGANAFESTRTLIRNGVSSDVEHDLSSQSDDDNNNNNSNLYSYNLDDQNEGRVSNRLAMLPVSSPRSCVTSLISHSNTLDFSTTNKLKRSLQGQASHQPAHNSNSESNITATGGLPKKPRAQSSSTPPLKVRKEKLGDRITALHQLVSPFGKTDTASVLLEAMGYIRFLQAQIQALSSPYLGNNNNNNALTNNQHLHYDKHGGGRDLKSSGLCLIPIFCTHLVGRDNGADYWAQSLGGGF